MDLGDLTETKVTYFMDHKSEGDAPFIVRNPSLTLSETSKTERDALYDIITNLRVTFINRSLLHFLSVVLVPRHLLTSIYILLSAENPSGF
jgi:hypothetical protein